MKKFYSFLLIGLLFLQFSSAQTNWPLNNKIRIYFNTPVNTSISTGYDAVYVHNALADTLVAYINRATTTLDFCVFETLSSSTITPIITAVNNAYSRGVTVRWIYDGSMGLNALSGLNSNIQTLASPTGSNYNIMHCKFVVIDAGDVAKATVWTGSTNFTTDMFNTDYNNVVIIQDKPLAQAYTSEFNMMWGSNTATPNSSNAKFGPDKTDPLTTHTFTIGGKTVELYFSPTDGTDDHIVSALNTANTDLYFGVYTFTMTTETNAIVSKVNAGIYTAGIIDSYSTSYTPYSTLSPVLGTRLKVYSSSTYCYHNKFAIVDPSNMSSDPVVVTGSHNWTATANTKNDENTLIIHDAYVANIFLQSFYQNFLDLGGTLSIPTVNVTGISVAPTMLNLTVGGSSSQLTASIIPSNATNQTMTWTSSNSNIATVSSTGLVSPVAAGSCTVTVTTQDGAYTANCAVTVNSGTVSVTGVAVSPTLMNLTQGGASGQLTATIQPSNATNLNVTWSSNNTSIATVSTTGLVTPVAVGNCNVTVTTQDGGYTATAQINVVQGSTALSTIVNWSFALPYMTGQLADGGIPANVGVATMAREPSYADGYLYFAGAGATGDSSIRTLTWDSTGVEKYWVATFTTSGYQNLKFSSKQRSSSTAPVYFKVQYAVNSSGPWTDVPGATVAAANDFLTGVLDSVDLPVACNDQQTLYLRWLSTRSVAVSGSAVSAAGASRIDEVMVIGSLITGENINNISDICLFPNPARDFIYVQSGSEKISEIEIFDIYGKKVMSMVNRETGNISGVDISNLSDGTYFISISSEKSRIVKKMVVCK